MTFDRTTHPESVGRDTARSVSKILLTAVSLVFVLYLATLLPGVDRIVPQTPVTFAAVVGAVVSLVLVALLLYAAPKVASLARLSLQGPQKLVENLVSISYWLVVLAAVFVAHRGLSGAVVPFFEGFAWLYDVVFLLLSLPILAFIVARLCVSVDPGADLLAGRIAGDRDDSEPSPGPTSYGGTEPAEEADSDAERVDHTTDGSADDRVRKDDSDAANDGPGLS